MDALLEEAVETPGRDVREIERGGARTAQARARQRHFAEEAHVAVQALAVAERKARADQRIRQTIQLADADAPLVQIRAAAARCGEEVVARRIVDDGLLHDALVRERDRHAVVREAVDEVGRAVERIDDPLELRLAIRFAGFFGEDGVIGIGGVQRLDDGGFGRLVDFRHEVVVLFLADLDAVQIERRAVDDLSGAARGLDSDIEHRMHERNPLTAGRARVKRMRGREKLATTTMSTKDELNKSEASARRFD